MKRTLFTILWILLWGSTLYLPVGYAQDNTITPIKGPWLWMIAPTEPGLGGAASIDVDSLAVASGGAVTEAAVAVNGATEGDRVGDYTWTLAELPEERNVNQSYGNINHLLVAAGVTEKNNLDHFSSYALIVLESATDQSDVIMQVGSDDAIKVWLNGNVVHTNAINRATTGFNDTFTVDLVAGDNLLLVKVSEWIGAWKMFVGVDANVNLKVPIPAQNPKQPAPQPQPTPIVFVIWYYPQNEMPYDGVNSSWKINIDTIDGIMDDVNKFYFSNIQATFNYKRYHIRSIHDHADLLSYVKSKTLFDEVFADIEQNHQATFPNITSTQDPNIYLVIIQSESDAVLPGWLNRSGGLARGRRSIVATGNHGFGIGGHNIGKGEANSPNSIAKTIAHELGHNFRLMHTPDYGHIMGYDKKTDLHDNYFTRLQIEWLSRHRVFNGPMPLVGQDAPFTVSFRSNPTLQLQIEVTTPNSNVAESVSQFVVKSLPGESMEWLVKDMWVGSVSSPISFSDWGNPTVQISTIDINGHITSSYPKLFDLFVMAVDLDGNGVVDVHDLNIVVADYGKIGNIKADVNGNGYVEVADMLIVAAIWKITAAVGVPAPATLTQVQSHFTASQLQEWLAEAHASGNTSGIYQHGIAMLAQLLALFTPVENALLANYPNPFNPETWIPYQLAAPGDVSISIYAADGQLMRTMALGHQRAGIYQSRRRAAHWDGRNAVGEAVASGVYFYTLTAGDFSATRKMLILK